MKAEDFLLKILAVFFIRFARAIGRDSIIVYNDPATDYINVYGELSRGDVKEIFRRLGEEK